MEFKLKLGDYVQFRNGEIGKIESVRDYSEDDQYKFDVCRLNSEGCDCYGLNGEFWVGNGKHELDIVRVVDLRDFDRLAAVIEQLMSNVVTGKYLDFVNSLKLNMTPDEFKNQIDTILLGVKND